MKCLVLHLEPEMGHVDLDLGRQESRPGPYRALEVPYDTVDKARFFDSLLLKVVL